MDKVRKSTKRIRLAEYHCLYKIRGMVFLSVLLICTVLNISCSTQQTVHISNNTNEALKVNNYASLIDEVQYGSDTIIDPRQLFTFTDSVTPFAPHLTADITNYVANDLFLHRKKDGVDYELPRNSSVEYYYKPIWLNYMLNCFADTIASHFIFRPTRGEIFGLTVLLPRKQEHIGFHYMIYIRNFGLKIPIKNGIYIFAEDGQPIGYYATEYEFNKLIIRSDKKILQTKYDDRQLNNAILFYKPIISIGYLIIYPESFEWYKKHLFD